MLILKGPLMAMDHRSGEPLQGRGVLGKEKGSCIDNGLSCLEACTDGKMDTC